MFGVNIDDNNIKIERKGLESLLTDKPEAAKRLREVIRKLLWEARNEVAADVKGKFGGDREPWRAVRNIVYEKLLGGNLNIEDMKRGTAGWKVIQKVRKGTSDPLGRGGNRRRRSLATAKREGYEGKARGFISASRTREPPTVVSNSVVIPADMLTSGIKTRTQATVEA
jgi:hypothetical protein